MVVQVKTLKPRDVASQYRISINKVLAWIRSGKLRAVNVGSGKRKQWRIKQEDLDTFFEKRLAKPASKVSRRRRAQPGVTQYF